MDGPSIFSVITASTAKHIVEGDIEGCVDVVRAAYLDHHRGRVVNPHSTFLRFPERPDARIIGLPAHVSSPYAVSGIKWIASYPQNVEDGLPRASAVLVLNRDTTGFPFACLEASAISAARTAASAVLAAEYLLDTEKHCGTLGIIGCGVIAGYVYRFLLGAGWTIDHLRVYDSHSSRSVSFVERERAPDAHASVMVTNDLDSTLAAADLAVFATVAARPHVVNPQLLAHCPVILHLSLRDLAPELMMGASNVVDDADHVMRENTSLHLAENLHASRDFISGTLAEVISGECPLQRDRPVIFSPFGLGMLDVALGTWVFDQAVARSEDVRIADFFDLT
jgi:ornithine cyclodeaminase